jgi:uncharacterized protein YbjT (DUF2867 family)
VTSGRRSSSSARLPPSATPEDTAQRSAKLEEHVVDAYAPHAALFRGDAHFCIVGAPRHSLPSAAEYERVNKALPLQCAALAREAGASFFTHVSSVGANAHSLVPYLRIKGQMGADLAGRGFPRLAVWRPGLLDRGALSTRTQAIATWLLPSMPVARVARAMRVHAERELAGLRAGGGPKAETLFNADILRLSAA